MSIVYYAVHKMSNVYYAVHTMSNVYYTVHTMSNVVSTLTTDIEKQLGGNPARFPDIPITEMENYRVKILRVTA